MSVVAASYNRRSRLASFVDAVLVDPAATELIVVVDGCDDGSIEMLEERAAVEPRLKPVMVSHRGHLACLQAGVEIARSQVVLLLDDDVLAHRGLVSGHAARHVAGDDLVVMGYMPVVLAHRRRHGEVGTYVYAAEYEQHCSRIDRGELTVLDGLWAGNISMPRRCCIACGLWSESFPHFYHSDRDLGLRLQACGLKGDLDRSLTASHLHERSTSLFLRDALAQGKGLALLHEVHAETLGPLDRSQFYADLPGAMRYLVQRLGGSKHCQKACRVLGALSGALGRLRWFAAETAVAKLARRALLLCSALPDAGAGDSPADGRAG